MVVHPVIAGIALSSSAIAVFTDVRYGKIYNKLTFPLLGISPLVQLAVHGWAGFGASLLGGLGAAGALLLLSMVAGLGLGGGDLKLLVALGTLFGWPVAGWLLLYTALGGFLCVIPVLLRRRIFWSTWSNLGMNLFRRSMGEKDRSLSEDSRGPRIPYAIGIFVGTAAAIFLGPLA